MKTDLREKIRLILKDEELSDARLAYILLRLTTEYEMHHAKINDTVTLQELFDETITTIWTEDGDNKMIKTGFSNLDKITGGLYPGEFIVLGGRPAMGKTQLLVTLALNISKIHPVLYFTFDLPTFLLGSRFISALSHIGVDRILAKDLREGEEEIAAAREAMNIHKIMVCDSGSNSVTAMKSHIISQIEKHDIKVVIVDYLQLMSSNKYRYNRDQEISAICRELKKLAGERGLAIIVSSQLTRAVDQRGGTRRPQLADLRESGSIEQDADKVLMMYRMEYYGFYEDEDGESTKGITEVIVAKNRNGRLGTARLIANDEFTSFTDFEERTDTFNINKKRLGDLLDSPF